MTKRTPKTTKPEPIAARIEKLDGDAGTAHAPGGDGAPSAPTAPVAGGTPAQADAAQPAAKKPVKGKTGGGKKATTPKPAKAAKPAKEPKAKKAKEPKPPKVKKVSALDAAAQVLARAKEPMRSQQLIDEMAAKGLWTSPGGQTPEATLYSAILREITTKGKESRFKKADRGQFAAA